MYNTWGLRIQFKKGTSYLVTKTQNTKSKNITCLFKEKKVKHVNYEEIYSIVILVNNQYEFGL